MNQTTAFKRYVCAGNRNAGSKVRDFTDMTPDNSHVGSAPGSERERESKQFSGIHSYAVLNNGSLSFLAAEFRIQTDTQHRLNIIPVV